MADPTDRFRLPVRMLIFVLASCGLPTHCKDCGSQNDTSDADTSDADTADSNTADTAVTHRTPVWMCSNGETMDFDPLPVDASVPLTIFITGATGYVYVDLVLTGPGTATVEWQGVTGTGPYIWQYGVTNLVEGNWFANFTADSGATTVCTSSLPVYDLGTVDTGPHDTGAGAGIAVSGTSLTLDSAPFRFVGFNTRGLAHYGGGDILPYTSSDDVATTLDAVQAAGGTVIRVFAANHDVSDDVAADRLATLLDACQARGLHVIVALTDEYATGFSPEGDDGAYYVDGNGYTVLSPSWYASGWHDHYGGWVDTVVGRNAGHPALLGWEPGNETKQPDDPEAWLTWLGDVSAKIRAADPVTPIVAGTIDIASTAIPDPAALADIVDILTVHLYDGAESDDLATAESLGMPILVEEIGFSSGDRASSITNHAGWAYGSGADGYMQWGLMATGSDDGDGDRTYGMDRVFHDDWDDLTSAYQSVAVGL
ncbi:MAG: hypothetical protein EXR71_21100 [Myxococcales bacterium]|nr:hypothetical protein [Myxococcales bacterium]